MKLRSGAFALAYSLVFLGGAKLITYFYGGEILSFWAPFLCAALFSMAFCTNAHALWITPCVYFILFTLDLTFGWQLITSTKTESLTTGLFATIIFVIPLLLGWGARKLSNHFRGIRSKSRAG